LLSDTQTLWSAEDSPPASPPRLTSPVASPVPIFKAKGYVHPVTTARRDTLAECRAQAALAAEEGRESIRVLPSSGRKDKAHRFGCMFCPATFIREHDAKRHQGSDLKTCDGCGQTFPRGDARGRHWLRVPRCRLRHAAIDADNEREVDAWEKRKSGEPTQGMNGKRRRLH
jgi:hypothetical protein